MATGNDLVAQARRVLGAPYVYGADGPNAFDCSGLVKWCCDNLGITSCPRTSEEQWAWVKRSDTPRPGDLVFFVGAEPDPSPGHVGIVVAPGQMINAPYTGSYVQQTGYGVNGVGVNKLVGFGQIPNVASGGPSAGNQNVPASTSARDRAGATIGAYVATFGVFAFVIIGLIIAALFLWRLF